MSKNLVILCSGEGSIMEAITQHIKQGDINASLQAVITNCSCPAIERANRQSIKTHIIQPTKKMTRTDYDDQLAQTIDHYCPDFIILSGFMRVLSSGFVKHYQDKLINIHPSLLPDYKGLNTHQRVLDAGDQWHGSSVHNVTAALDSGSLIAQSRIKIQPNDTADSLQQRVKKLEHHLYPWVIKQLCDNNITIKQNKIYYKKEILTEPLLI